LYSILNQFYEVGPNKMYYVIENTGASHLDINELVIQISTILSNKILGKNIIKNVEPISNDTLYL
jgi:stage III sporulation protein SpoIIIAA